MAGTTRVNLQSAMSNVAAPRSHRGLRLEDYLAHQRALRSLLLSHPVWIVDDVLGLRYRARLRLRLDPFRHLLLTEDTGEEVNGGDGASVDSSSSPSLSACSSSSSSPAVVIPLLSACVIDCCGGGADGQSLRIVLPSSSLTSTVSEVTAENAPAAPVASAVVDVVYVVEPVAETHRTAVDAEAVAQTWAAVLSSLCQPPHHTTASPEATSSALSSGRKGNVERVSPAAAAPAVPSTSAVAGVPSLSLPLHRDPTPHFLATLAAVPVSLPATTTTTPSAKPAAAEKPTPSPAVPRADAALSLQGSPSHGADQHTLLSNNHNNDTANSTRVVTSPSPSPPARVSDAPPPPSSALIPSDNEPAASSTTTTDNNGLSAHEKRMLRLTRAIRSRTHEAAVMIGHLRTSLSPARGDVSADSSRSTVQVEMPETGDVRERDRPPTMAHIASGLVPALSGSHLLVAIDSSSDDEFEEDAEDTDGEVQSGNGASRGGRPAAAAAATATVAVTAALSSSHGAHIDSPRPQAPRGGHVGTLGSIGPCSGDEEALRIYNEIHGSHSSDGDASSSFPSSLAFDRGDGSFRETH